MDTSWLLIANRTAARLFEYSGQELEKLEEISHPEGRLRDQELVSDDKGRVHDRAGQGSHKQEPHESASDHEDRRFAQALSRTLRKGLDEHRFVHLFLVAEPGFLGDLKQALDKETTDSLAGTLGKDLVHVEDRDIPGHLDALLNP